MKLLSWNVNGLRAVHKKGALEPFLQQAPDMFTLQEIKATPEQLPEEVRTIPGYHAYFTYPTEKKGYSGVALYTKTEPARVEEGMGERFPDVEGRMLTAFFEPNAASGGDAKSAQSSRKWALVCVYIPNGGGGPERFEYKLDYLDAYLEHLNNLRSQGYGTVTTGDINIAHEEIDLARPKGNEDNPGFRIEVREWFDELMRQGYIDTFRHQHPDARGAYSYWDMQTFARERNVGWRIDYVILSAELAPHLKKSLILSDILGSDHCPVGVELDL